MEAVKSGIKKVAVMFIAALMLLGVVPIGLVSKPDTVNAEGEFLRLFSDKEAFVSSVRGERDKIGDEISANLLFAGDKYDAYMKYDFSDLSDIPVEEIHKVVLRLAYVNTGINSNGGTVRLWQMADKDWNEDISFKNRPTSVGEEKITEFYVEKDRKTGTVTEIELTQQVKTLLEKGEKEIYLHLDGAEKQFAAAFAAGSYEDAAFRPCLKAITGNAYDTDRDDLTKAWLESSYVEDGKVYMTFCFNRDNIRGAMYDIHLRMPMRESFNGEYAVELLDKKDMDNFVPASQCHGEKISDGKILADNREVYADITYGVNDVYRLGRERITLRISCSTDDGIQVIPSGTKEAELEIRATDNRKIMATMEASAAALGLNLKADRIKEDLLRAYTSREGVKAYIKWAAYDAETGERIYGVIDSNGTITPPEWFESPRQILAKATIYSGAYMKERSYMLTIMPDKPPEFNQSELTEYEIPVSKKNKWAKKAEQICQRIRN